MAMTQAKSNIQSSSRPNQRAPGEEPKIIDSQKILGDVVHRGYEARLVGI